MSLAIAAFLKFYLHHTMPPKAAKVIYPDYSFEYPDEETEERVTEEEASDISDEANISNDPILNEIAHPAPVVPQEEDPPDKVIKSRESTAKKRRELNANGHGAERTHQAVLNTITAMQINQINLPIFLDALSWGNQYCVADDKCRTQRTTLLHSEELSWILQHWHKPPRSSGGITRPAAGTQTIREFAIEEVILPQAHRELMDIAPKFRLPAGDDVDPSQLTHDGIQEMAQEMKVKAPVIWQLLEGFASTKAQKSDNTHKDPSMEACPQVEIKFVFKINQRVGREGSGSDEKWCVDRKE